MLSWQAQAQPLAEQLLGSSPREELLLPHKPSLGSDALHQGCSQFEKGKRFSCLIESMP